MKTITKICLCCEKEFEAAIREHNRGNAKFCSLSCSSKFTHLKQAKELRQPNVCCAQCGKMFYKNKSKQSKSRSGLFFCCRKCKDTAQRIGGIHEIQPSHYGTGTGIYNYRNKAFNAMSPICNRCEYSENIFGLIVHHKNKNREDNSLENLEILCGTCHAIEHHKCSNLLHLKENWTVSESN